MKRWKYALIVFFVYFTDKIISQPDFNPPFWVLLGLIGTITFIQLISAYYRAIDANKLSAWSTYWKLVAIGKPTLMAAFFLMGLTLGGTQDPDLEIIMWILLGIGYICGIGIFCYTLMFLFTPTSGGLEYRPQPLSAHEDETERRVKELTAAVERGDAQL